MTAPTLVLGGDEDHFGTYEGAKSLEDRMADARVEFLSEAGHAPWLDRPEAAVASMVLRLAGDGTLVRPKDRTLMRYALLLYAEVGAAQATTQEQAAAELQRYGRITQTLADEGVLRGGEAFLPASTARRVTIFDGATRTSDVPSSALELSGYYVVECDEDRAIEIAGELPVAGHGQVEVRPLMDLPAPS